MNITTRNRAELKSYFVKNAIPTESNFAELIDGMLNQKADGVVKLPGDPLSIEAVGDENSSKTALNFYRDITDSNPDWSISLNPGFSISDGENNSRLFIDRENGNVGMGTDKPQQKLVVVGKFNTGKDPESKMDHGGNLAIKSDAPQIDFIDTDNNNWSIHVNANKMYFIRQPWEASDLVLDGAGNVGIGTDNPDATLEVMGAAHINGGTSYANKQGFMANGSLTIGSINKDYGGGNGWTENTAGLLLEAKNNTEIAVHDSGTRVASLMYYKGDKNSFTIGRDMGWGTINKIIIHGNIGIGTPDIHNPQGWDKTVDILGPNHARFNVRSSNVITSVFSHNNWNGARGVIGTESNHPLTFATNYTHQMTLDINGNVGIGTDNPQQKLVIVGTNNAGKDPDSNMTAAGNFAIKSNAPQIDFIDTDHNDWSIHVNSNKLYFIRQPWEHNDLVLDGAGNVGIGTSTPQSKLDVAGPIFERLDLIRCGNRGDWTAHNHPIMVYFKTHLTGKPVGTMARAIQDHPSWRGHYWKGWVDVDGNIRVIHNHHNTGAYIR
jgi:hypothetical protein